MNGAQALGCSPVATAFAAGHRRVPAGQAEHDRQVAGDRQPGRRPVRDRARPPHRRQRSTASPTTRSAPASACWPRRPASSPRPPAASPSRTLAKLAARGDIGPDERVVAMVTGDGLKTIDAVRDTFEVTTIPAVAGRLRRALRAGGGMSVTVKLPTQLRDAAGGATSVSVDGAHGRRGPRRALRRARRAALADRRRRRRAAPLRQRVPQGRGHPLPRRSRAPPVADGDEVTILPAVAGG